jgi:hypothetical protein
LIAVGLQSNKTSNETLTSAPYAIEKLSKRLI